MPIPITTQIIMTTEDIQLHLQDLKEHHNTHDIELEQLPSYAIHITTEINMTTRPQYETQSDLNNEQQTINAFCSIAAGDRSIIASVCIDTIGSSPSGSGPGVGRATRALVAF